jgi:hypothetical protein
LAESEPAAIPVPVEKPDAPKPPQAESDPVRQAAVPPPPEPEPARSETAPPAPAAVERVEASPPVPVPVVRPRPPTPRPQQVAARPEPEPEPEEKTDSFLNVLKTVQDLKKNTPRREAEAQPTPVPEAETTARRAPFDADRPLSVSELDAIRRQISNCWNVPAGAKNAGDLLVEIEVTMNQDRTVRFAEVTDSARMYTDRFFRAAAEAALRALRNPACSPLQLPPEKYDTWKNFTITFDPKDMLS